MTRSNHWLIAGVIPALVLPVLAHAQTPPATPGATPPAAGQRLKAAPPPSKDAAATAASSDAALKKRVEQLEEQLVDLQVVIGTLESLAKQPQGANAAAYRAPASGAGDGRIDGVEMQIKALT